MAMESGGEKVACDMAEANLAAAATGDCRAALHWGQTGRRSTALALSLDRRKRFGTGLAGKRIFHIGNAKKAPTVP
jgi:hypothetical protein